MQERQIVYDLLMRHRGSPSLELEEGRCSQGSEGHGASGPLESSVDERVLEEVSHPQRVGPVTEVGQIKRRPLPSHNSQNVIPLASRGASSHVKPLEFCQDSIVFKWITP